MAADKKTALFSDSEQAVSKYILHTPTPFAKDNLIYLQEAGILQAVKPYTTGRAGLNSYLFFQVLEGKGEFIYEGMPYKLNTGDCVFIDCRKKYSQITSKELWKLQWVHFNGGTMDGIYRKFIERGGKPVFHTEYRTQYLDILNQIYNTALENEYLVNMELSEKLMSLLSLLMRETWGAANRKQHSKLDIQSVKKYLDEHYMENITLDALAESFYIDKFYLTKIFKLSYDTTINHYLNGVRITKAKELLRFTDLPIEKLCAKVGIAEPNYFTRVFKKVEGISPSTYRAQW